MHGTMQQPTPEEPTFESSLPTSLEPEAISFNTMLSILFAERRTILLSGLVTFVLAAIFAFLLPNTYKATTSFVPPGSNSAGASSAAIMGQLSALGAGGLLAGKGQGDLYVGVLKSHTIARNLIQRFHLMDVYKVKKESVAETILEKNSTFTLGTKDPIVIINVVDKSPERARDLANGYLEALQSTTTGLALTESSQRRLFYEQRLAKEKDELANAEVALKQTQEKSGLIAPAGQTSSEIQTLAQLRSQTSERQVRLASLLHDESDENPDVIRLRNEIASLQTQTSQLENGQGQRQFGRFSTVQVPELELDYIRKARDVKYHETLFDIIARQYEVARIDEAKDSPLQVLDQATVPDTKSGPHRTILSALGLIIGLVFGAAWTLLKTLRASAVRP